jgi:hypothetical protein
MVTTPLDALSHCPFVVEQASDGVLLNSFFCFHNSFYLLFLCAKVVNKNVTAKFLGIKKPHRPDGG